MVLNKQFSAIVLGGMFLSISCLSPGAGPKVVLPLASQEQNRIALTFPTVPDKTVIYIFRPYSMPWLRALILVDNRKIGFTASKTFMRMELNPGVHELTCELESSGNRSKEFQSKPNAKSNLALQAEPGKIYFVRQSPSPWSWNGRLDLHLVPAVKGESEITRGKYLLLDPIRELQ
jgi:hypothetical protein